MSKIRAQMKWCKGGVNQRCSSPQLLAAVRLFDSAYIVTVIVVIIGIHLIARPKALGNISNRYAMPTTTISDISFSGEAGDRIKFSFRSNIENGDLDITLYDSEGNDVYKLDRAKELETFFTVNNSDTYTLTAECNGFIGNYKIKVYKVD